jgi:hypothetical protein
MSKAKSFFFDVALHEDEEKEAKSESKKYYVDMKIHVKLFFSAFFLMRHRYRQDLRFNPNSVIHSDVLLLSILTKSNSKYLI